MSADNFRRERVERLLDRDTVEAVAAGLYDEGDTVTITGIMNGPIQHTTKLGAKWATFVLIGERTAVETHVFPELYASSPAVFESAAGLRPTAVTVTATVTTRDFQPGLLANQITRTAEAVPS